MEENSWRGLVLAWANRLNLTNQPAQQMIDFTDGKFFAEFMAKHLPSWKTKGQTSTETFSELEAGFKNEFTTCSVVNTAAAMEGHEDELVKALTLLMYLGTVKHLSQELSSSLQVGFSREAQLRLKCVLQALMEQHATLSPETLTTIMMAKVSETTGQLTAPVFRTRLADRPATRVAKPSVSSPVIFTTGSPTSNSPLKDFLDSPATRREAQYQRQIEQRNQQNRHLRTQLEGEKTEKQFALEELERVQEERSRLQQELAGTKQAAREQLARAEKERDQGHESDLQTRFHANLDQLRDEIKYRESVERELAEAKEENEKLAARFTTLGQKLSEATDDKHRVEISLEDMRHNLTEAQEERTVLGENLLEAQTQIEELMQLNTTQGSGGLARRQSLAPSMSTFHTADMTNVSLDADDSVGVMATSNSMEEDMRDVAKQQWEERLESVEVERNRVEVELSMEKEVKERLQLEFIQEKEARLKVEKNLAEETAAKEEVERKLKTETEKTEGLEVEKKLEAEERSKVEKQLQEEIMMKKNVEEQLAVELQVREKLTGDMMQGKVVQEELERKLLEQKENSCKVEELLGQKVSSLKEELQQEKQVGEEARRQADQNIGAKIQEISQLEIRLHEESSLKLNMEAKMNEEKKELLRELEEKSGNLHQLRSEVALKEEQIGILQEKLEQQKTENIKAEEILSKEQSISETRRTEYEEKIQGARMRQERLEAELAQMTTSKSELSKQLEHMTTSHVNLETRLQEEQSTRAHIMSTNLQLEEAKASLTREAVEQNMQLTQLSERIAVASEELVRMEKDILEQTEAKIQLQEELAASRVKLNESQAECESTKQQLNTTVEDVELMRSQMKGEVERHLNEVAEIQSNMEKVEVRLEEEVSQRVLLEALKVELTGRLEEKQAESEDSKKQLRLKDEEIENLTHDMEITRTSHLNKEALLTSSNDRIQALTTQMGAMEENHRCEVEKFEVEGRKRLDQLGSAGEEMGRLQAEVAELKAEMERREELCKEHIEVYERLKADGEKLQVERKNNIEILEKRLIQAEELLETEKNQSSKACENTKELEGVMRSLNQELASAIENKDSLERELRAKLSASADEVTELNGQVSAYAEELRGTKERESEHTQKLQAGALELVAKDVKIQELMAEKESIQELLKNVQEIKEAQNTSFEALKTRTSHVSLEHVAAMEKVRLLEENNTRLQEEMDKVVEERKSVDEMMIRMGSKEQELQLELQQEKETVKELSENWDKRGCDIEALEKEKTELRGMIDALEKKVEEGNSEMNHKLEFLQSQLEEMETEKEEIKKAKSVLEAEVLEIRGELQKTSQDNEILKEERKNKDDTVAVEEASQKAEKERIMLEKENLSTEVARLEKELKIEMESKNTLAQSVSQLITDTNALKNQLRQEQANREKQKEVDAALEKEKEELQGQLMQAEAKAEELQSKVEAGAVLEEKLTKVQQELVAYEAKYNSMQAELATSEIKNSDLEQTLEGKGEEVSNALAEQKERYDKRHKEVIAAQAKKWQGKMQEFCEIANKKVTDAEEKLAAAESKVKGQESELKSICVSNERLKKMVERMEEAEKLSEKEKEMLETRYTKAREDGKILLAKYERQKEATAKAAEQAAEQNEVVTIRQELIRVKSENRTLSNQLSYADTRLREYGRHEGFGTSMRSRDSISVPGRVTRQTSSRDSEGLGVFKLPGSQGSQGTPGRTRTSRTVSETRVARTRPPLGSGSLFHADEEVGEVFSSSYLSDLKEGNCTLDDTGRMSELARRNTLAPAHLKSAYPIESQFFDDNSMTEESIRHSRLPMRQSIRLSTVPGNQTTSFSSGAKAPLNLSALPADTSRELAGVNSPAVNRLSQATSSMSLDSPSTATRSKRTLSNLSTADLPAKKRVPPPTAFTIDAPKPGNAVRKGKVTKQPCTQEHGAKKQVCEAPHPTNDEESHATPQPRRSGRRSGELATQEDSQQDATFVRDTTRASKRSNVSYMKPGPPTPGRNKSLESNTSLESTPADVTSVSSASTGTPRSKRSTTSLAKSLKTPLLDSTNQSTPGTSNKSKFKQVKGMTPLTIKKAISGAFRSKGLKNKSSTYQLMKKQDQTIDRDQSKSKGVKVTTPMKAKERLGRSPRTMHK